MACLSPLSSARGRRLFELLEEQQEPFLMDNIYHQENGRSDKLLSPHHSMCWPGSAYMRMQRMASHGFKRRRGGLFKCRINKFLRGWNSIRKALKWDVKAPDNRSLNKCHSSTDVGISKMNDNDDADHKEEAAGVQFSSSTERINGVTEEESLSKCSKQLSPVSVLGMHSYQGSQNMNGEEEEDMLTFGLELQRKALDIFEELLRVAYTPAFGRQQPDQPPKLRGKEEVMDTHECPSINGDELDVVELLTVAEEVSHCWRKWIQFQPQVMATGVEVDNAIF